MYAGVPSEEPLRVSVTRRPSPALSFTTPKSTSVPDRSYRARLEVAEAERFW